MPDTIDRLEGARTTFGMKKPVGAATTGAITLSGEQTIDGVLALEEGRVLVKDQADSAFNGIYIVSTGDWERAVDFDGTTDWVTGTLIPVAGGTINAGKIFRVTSANPENIDDDDITFESISFADPHANVAIVASATLDLDAVDADAISVTGSGASISAITLTEGRTRILRFTEAGNILVHSASFVLPGALNITTIANDHLIIRGYASGVVRVISYLRGDAHPLVYGNATVASAATTDLGAVRENAVTLTGSVTITSFGTSAPSGAIKFLRMAGSLLTHSSALLLPGARNIQSADGDTCIARMGNDGNWRVMNYTRNEFGPHVDATQIANASTSESDLSNYILPAGRLASSGAALRIKAWGFGTTVSTAASRRLRMYFGSAIIADTGSQNVPVVWMLEATVVRTTNAGLQNAFGEVLISTGGAGSVLYQHTGPTENLASNINIKVTGLCTASTGVLTQYNFLVEQLTV